MKVLAIMVVLASSAMASAQEERQEFSAANLATVVIQSGSGTVKAIGTDGNRIVVKATKERGDSNCRLLAAMSGQQLVVKADPKSNDCKMSFDVTFPPSLALDAQAGSGAIAIGNAKANVNAQTGSGAIKIAGEIQKLVAYTGSGAIEVKGQRGDAKLRTGSGDISVMYQLAPKAGTQLEMSTGSGSAHVTLPAGATAKTKFASANGEIENAKPGSDNSALQVSFNAGSGSLHIK